MLLDVEAARVAIAALAKPMGCTVEQAAEGIIKLANEHMVQALRVISVQRGCDPGEYALVSFGGAGGLHVCDLAEALKVNQVIVPIHGGVLSALGMLVTPGRRRLSHTLMQDIREIKMENLLLSYQVLVDQGLEELGQEGVESADIVVSCSLDLRYQGQSYNLNVDFDRDFPDLDDCQQRFNELHQRLYGHSLQEPVELVTIRVAVSGPATDIRLESCVKADQKMSSQVCLYGVDESAQLMEREALEVGRVLPGPALISETVASTYIAPGWQCIKDKSGNLLLTLK